LDGFLIAGDFGGWAMKGVVWNDDERKRGRKDLNLERDGCKSRLVVSIGCHLQI
jgi:hypothetical protein